MLGALTTDGTGIKGGPTKEFVGVQWEPDTPVGANRKAEMAVLYLALTADHVTEELFAKVQPRDFMYDDCRFVFNELVIMRKDGLPLTDKAAMSSWFNRPDVLARCQQANLDWVDDMGKQNPCAFIYALMIDAEWATAANLDYYMKELRMWRLTRGVRTIAFDLSVVISDNPNDPLAAIDFMNRRAGELTKLAETIRENNADNQSQKEDGVR